MSNYKNKKIKKYKTKKYKTKKYKTKKYKIKKYKTKKTKKYKKKKKYGGSNLISNYQAIEITTPGVPHTCNEECNSSKFSNEFHEIYSQYKDLLENRMLDEFPLTQEKFIDLFSELAVNTGSYTFYKTKLQLYSRKFKQKDGRNVKTPQKEDIPSLINYICNITGREMCVLIGFAEMLAIFGINFYEQLRGFNLETMNRDEINDFVRKEIKYVVSSMDENKWSPKLNQQIIIDTLNDIPRINMEPWHLKNAALCLLMPEKIHNDDELLIDWNKALDITKCRVTRDEICLIAIHKNLNIFYIKVTNDCHLYVFTKN